MTADVRGNSLEVVHLFQDRLVRREGQKRVRFRSHVKKEERFRYIEEAIKKEGCEGAGMGTRREEDQGPWKQTKSRPLCLAKRHVQVDQQTGCDDRKQGGITSTTVPSFTQNWGGMYWSKRHQERVDRKSIDITAHREGFCSFEEPKNGGGRWAAMVIPILFPSPAILGPGKSPGTFSAGKIEFRGKNV
ncbi:hypothetical protein An05g00560 [Aspergillus niger]|uniref:Uncharacterized protein n=2 Tax=Aspergillus niger TaxID=5061 RepID=A2QKK8_ASPNC|nr:hypothetical protein An05g00560 [Aspergillus niger]CAK39091.1 hypothetical protein An05g00560 [Aspergillus niger]